MSLAGYIRPKHRKVGYTDLARDVTFGQHLRMIGPRLRANIGVPVDAYGASGIVRSCFDALTAELRMAE